MKINPTGLLAFASFVIGYLVGSLSAWLQVSSKFANFELKNNQKETE